ncbi:hypothetical protein ACFLR4_02060 [Bacteroidota bacterium]
MRIQIRFIAILVIITFTSCDESFSPKTDLREEYLLTCLINCTSDYQTATITKAFDVEGFDPSSNTTELSLAGAYIRIWYQDTVFVMQDSTLDDDELVNGNKKHFYYLENFQPGYNEVLELEAILPNGRKLKSTTITPKVTPNQYFFGRGDAIIPPADFNEVAEEFVMIWEVREDPGPALFIPRLFIDYSVNRDGEEVDEIIEIPLEYVLIGDNYEPVYPPGTTQTMMRFKTSAINRTMEKISEGDPNKQNYSIKHGFIYFSVLDENLSAFYGALQIQSDGFTVRVDAPEYTNVEGGYGIFGTYFEKFVNVTIGKYYAESYGYKYVVEID